MVRVALGNLEGKCAGKRKCSHLSVTQGSGWGEGVHPENAKTMASELCI